MRSRLLLATFIVTIALISSPTSNARIVEYDLTIAEESVNITGEDIQAITINGDIPAPTLYFKDGDSAIIHVHNQLENETSIHWHGLLVPPGMDGVPYVSFPPIEAGTTFTYSFRLRQSGTYWYHSHTGLQEQRGMYGAIVIEPSERQLKYDREHTVVLSDWTNENPHSVIGKLKRGSEWYSIQKGAGQSLLGAVKAGMIGDFFKRELQRMPPMDLSDVAYDRFLANGSPEISLDAQAGERVRIRIVDGSSTTFFHLTYAGGPMTVVSADGLLVEPVDLDRFLIAVAETYDIIITIPDSGSYELRATAHDGSAFATIWLGSEEPRFAARPVAKPNVYHAMGSLSLGRIFALTPAGSMGMPDGDIRAGKFDRPGMMGMAGMSEMSEAEHAPGMDHMSYSATASEKPFIDTAAIDPELRNGKRYSTAFLPLAADAATAPELAIDGQDPARPWPPYEQLRALESTAFDAGKPVRELRLTLDGDMGRYVWFINNKPLSESDSILIKEGEIVRFIMINRTMMHHPMHLHGHFFRVTNRHGDYSPLKHTVDVAPMSTTVIEFDANEFGEWFFHCHLLYHLESGMARTVHYEGFALPPAVSAVRSKLYHDGWYHWLGGEAMTNMTEGMVVLANTRNIASARWEVGWHNISVTEWEADLAWDRYFNRFFTLFVGGNFLGVDDELEDSRAVAGFQYLLPLSIHWRSWVASDGTARFAFEKELMLLPRVGIAGEAEYDTDSEWEGSVGTQYIIAQPISIGGRWHSEFGWGGGVVLRL